MQYVLLHALYDKCRTQESKQEHNDLTCMILISNMVSSIES